VTEQTWKICFVDAQTLLIRINDDHTHQSSFTFQFKFQLKLQLQKSEYVCHFATIWGHGFDLLGTHDVIGHATILPAIYYGLLQAVNGHGPLEVMVQ